ARCDFTADPRNPMATGRIPAGSKRPNGATNFRACNKLWSGGNVKGEGHHLPRGRISAQAGRNQKTDRRRHGIQRRGDTAALWPKVSGHHGGLNFYGCFGAWNQKGSAYLPRAFHISTCI